jgi:hypothetical protein
MIAEYVTRLSSSIEGTTPIRVTSNTYEVRIRLLLIFTPCRLYKNVDFDGPTFLLTFSMGRATSEAVSAGFSPRRPGFDLSSGHVGFMVGKAAQWQASSSVSFANSHATTRHPQLNSRPTNGRRTSLTPPQ